MEVHLDDLFDKLEATHNERSLRAALRTFTDRVGFGGNSILAFISNRLRPEKVLLADLGRAHTAVAYLHLELGSIRWSRPQAFTSDLSPHEALCLTWTSLSAALYEKAVCHFGPIRWRKWHTTP